MKQQKRKSSGHVLSVGLITAIAAAAWLVRGWSPGSQAPGAAQLRAPSAAKIACSDLVQDGSRWHPAVPNFQEIPGAPTRVTSTRLVQATGT